MCQRGTGHRRAAIRSKYGNTGEQKRQVLAPWDWETSRHGEVNHGPTMGSLTAGSWENILDTGMAVRCPQGRGLNLRPPGQWPEYALVRA